MTDLRIFVAGRELESLKRKLDGTSSQRVELQQSERDVKANLADLDTRVMATESKLSAMGGDDLGDSLASFESLHERSRGLSSLLAERLRGIERERHAFVDQGVIATLEAEAARLRGELGEVDTEAELLAPQAAALAEAQEALAVERGAFESQWGEGVPAPSGAAAEVRGELVALRGAVERGEAEQQRVGARLSGLLEKRQTLQAEADRLRGELAAAEQSEVALVARSTMRASSVDQNRAPSASRPPAPECLDARRSSKRLLACEPFLPAHGPTHRLGLPLPATVGGSAAGGPGLQATP